MVDAALAERFGEEFRVCKVSRGQTVAVLSEADQLREYAETSLAVASALGAKVVAVNIASGRRKNRNWRLYPYVYRYQRRLHLP